MTEDYSISPYAPASSLAANPTGARPTQHWSDTGATWRCGDYAPAVPIGPMCISAKPGPVHALDRHWVSRLDHLTNKAAHIFRIRGALNPKRCKECAPAFGRANALSILLTGRWRNAAVLPLPYKWAQSLLAPPNAPPAESPFSRDTLVGRHVTCLEAKCCAAGGDSLRFGLAHARSDAFAARGGEP
jgi:hypothetical protein